MTWKSIPTNKEFRNQIYSILCCTVFGVLVLSFLTAGLSAHYYAFPFVVGCVIVILAQYVTRPNDFKGYVTDLNYRLVGFIFVAIVLGSSIAVFLPGIKDNLLLVVSRLSNNHISLSIDYLDNTKRLSGDFTSNEEERIGYIEMQEAVPAGEVFLARMEKPFLFDFARNPIFIIDIPGGASLPPGMPFFEGGEALSDYLLANNIRYVAYAYASECSFSFEQYGDTLEVATNIFIRTGARMTFDLNDNLKELGQTRERIFDDGINFVLDLKQKIEINT